MILLQQEFLAAVCMSVLTAVFALGMRGLEGEARNLPELLVWCMVGINLLQYGLAVYRKSGDINLLEAVRGYPFGLVGRLFAITLAYILTLLLLGFYAGSFLYLWFGSLMANPEPVTARIALVRAMGCGIFVGGMWALFSWSLGVIIPLGTLWP